MTTKTLRFWMWINGGPVRLTTRQGQTLRWGTYAPNDEGGYHAEAEELFYDGEKVERTTDVSGRDCDGGHSSHSESILWDICGVDDFDGLTDAQGRMIRHALWKKVGCDRCHDQFAEAAGY